MNDLVQTTRYYNYVEETIDQENIDIVFFNGFKKFVYMQTLCCFRNNRKQGPFLGSVIIAKKGTRVKEVIQLDPQNTSFRDKHARALDIIGVILETPIIGKLWIINVYNSSTEDLNLNEKVHNNFQNLFICRDLNSPHQ